MSNWYYKQGDQELGPVTQAELGFLASTGRITNSTPVRSGSGHSWQPFAPKGANRNVVKNSSLKTSTENGHNDGTVATLDQLTNSMVAAAAVAEQNESWSKMDADHRTRNAVIGAVAMMLLVLLLAVLFWDRLPSGAGIDSAGQAVAGNSSGDDAGDSTQHSDQENDSTGGAGASATATNQPIATSEPPATADDADSKSVANVGASQTSDDSAAGNTTNSPTPPQPLPESHIGQPNASPVVAGDPRSKFTIEAPGEARFFGLSASGRRFSFVVDRSGSMSGPPLQRAKEELMKCIRSLPQHVEVQVVFFDSVATVAPGDFEKLSRRRVDELQKWVETIAPAGGTNVDGGMLAAFAGRQKPDAIFLLTDGGFEGSSPDFIRQLNNSLNVQINTVALISDAGAPLLKQIARENNGDYRFVP